MTDEVKEVKEVKKEEKPKAVPVVYAPPPGEPVAVDAYGKRFVAGHSVDLDDPEMVERARGNPHFNVDGEDKAKMREEAAAKRAEADEAERKALLERDEHEMEERHARERADLEARQEREKARVEQRRKDQEASQKAHDDIRHDDGLDVLDDTAHRDEQMDESQPEDCPPVDNPPSQPPRAQLNEATANTIQAGDARRGGGPAPRPQQSGQSSVKI